MLSSSCPRKSICGHIYITMATLGALKSYKRPVAILNASGTFELYKSHAQGFLYFSQEISCIAYSFHCSKERVMLRMAVKKDKRIQS